MLKSFTEKVKDELYALRTRPQRRRIEKALKDENSIYSINLAKFIEDRKNGITS